MSINERTKYRISNKWNNETKKFDQDQFDFEDKGKVGVGKLNWSTKKTDKQGEVSFTPSSLKFVCFGETKELIANNLSAKFHIEASLCNESFTNQEGKKISFWQLTVFKAEIAEQGEYKEPTKKDEPAEDLEDDDIPF